MKTNFIFAESNGFVLIEKEVFRGLIEEFLLHHPEARLYLKESPEFGANALHLLKEGGRG